jgi:6-phosphofructokinase 1
MRCIAVDEGGGWMATILRQASEEYAVRYDKVPLGEVANSHRQLPKHWITPDGLDVTDEFIRYAQPLIGEGWPEIPVEGGLQRFARLEPSFVPTQLAKYVPENWR